MGGLHLGGVLGLPPCLSSLHGDYRPVPGLCILEKPHSGGPLSCLSFSGPVWRLHTMSPFWPVMGNRPFWPFDPGAGPDLTRPLWPDPHLQYSYIPGTTIPQKAQNLPASHWTKWRRLILMTDWPPWWRHLQSPCVGDQAVPISDTSWESCLHFILDAIPRVQMEDTVLGRLHRQWLWKTPGGYTDHRRRSYPRLRFDSRLQMYYLHSTMPRHIQAVGKFSRG